MKLEKQNVYLPVKVEDELPEYNSKEFTIDSKNRKSVHHTLEVLDENKDLYDKNRFLNFRDDSYVTHWLKQKEGYFFTPEQLNEYTQKVIKQSLESAAEKFTYNRSKYEYLNLIVIDKQSITNTFEEAFKKFEV